MVPNPHDAPVKAQLVTVDDHGAKYTALKFVCPGCVAGGPEGYDGLHILPVNATNHEPSWNWDENLDAPTLSPSILTEGYSKCHSYLENGVFRFLEDSTHPLAGQEVPLPDLPDWAIKMDNSDNLDQGEAL